MRHEGFAVRSGDHEMHVRWTKRVAGLGLKHVSHWSIIGNRICSGDNGLEPEFSLYVGANDAAARRTSETGFTLNVIEAFRVGVPKLDQRAGDRLCVDTADAALHK